MRLPLLILLLLPPALHAATPPPSPQPPRAPPPPPPGEPVIFQLRPGTPPATLAAVCDAVAGCDRTFGSVFVGGAAHVSPSQRAALDAHPAVEAVHDDHDVGVTLHGGDGAAAVPAAGAPAAAAAGVPWHLDRLDQRALPLDGRYDAPGVGTGAVIYVLDTGIRKDHAQFRYAPGAAPPGSPPDASRAVHGWSAFDAAPVAATPPSSDDCHGHGTHVAAIAAGLTYGVAPNATLVAVRAIACDGSAKASALVAGLDWVAGRLTAHARGGGHVSPPIVSLSAGTSRPNPAVDAAARAVVDAGAVVVAAAGNEGADACSQSPGRVPAVVTVGATAADDTAWPSSNGGPCVDLHAPGVAITSATWYGVDAAVAASGTSMAAPAVAGAAALIASAATDAPPPGAVAARLVEAATDGAVRGVANGTTTRLLYVAPGGDAAGGGAALTLTPTALAPVLAFQNTDALNATRTLTLTNRGRHDVTWTARADAQGLAAGWVSPRPPRGALAAGASTTLALAYDLSGAQFQGVNVADIVVTADSEAGERTTVTRRTEALVFCARLAGAPADGDRKLASLTVTDVALDRPDGWPVTAAGDDAPRAYVTLLAALSHPVRADALPPAALTLNGAPVTDVTPGGPDGRQCGQFVVRGAVAADGWAGGRADVCVATAPSADLRDATGVAFPPLNACISVPLPPRAILLAPLAPAAGGGGAQFGGTEVALLAAASAPLGTDPTPADFDVTGAPGARVLAVTAVGAAAGTRWHVSVGGAARDFYGPLRVAWTPRAASGRTPPAPPPPLVATRVRVPLVEGIAYRLVA